MFLILPNEIINLNQMFSLNVTSKEVADEYTGDISVVYLLHIMITENGWFSLRIRSEKELSEVYERIIFGLQNGLKVTDIREEFVDVYEDEDEMGDE